MRSIFFALILIFNAPLGAAKCPDVSGTYSTNNGPKKSWLLVERYGCTSIGLQYTWDKPISGSDFLGALIDVTGKPELIYENEKIRKTRIAEWENKGIRIETRSLDLASKETSKVILTIKLDADRNLTHNAIYLNSQGTVDHEKSDLFIRDNQE